MPGQTGQSTTFPQVNAYIPRMCAPVSMYACMLNHLDVKACAVCGGTALRLTSWEGVYPLRLWGSTGAHHVHVSLSR